MSEFLVETQMSPAAISVIASRVEDVSLAAAQVSEQGTDVSFLRAFYLPEDEACFYLYQSSSAAAVHEAATRAGLRVDGVTEGPRWVLAQGRAA